MFVITDMFQIKMYTGIPHLLQHQIQTRFPQIQGPDTAECETRIKVSDCLVTELL